MEKITLTVVKGGQVAGVLVTPAARTYSIGAEDDATRAKVDALVAKAMAKRYTAKQVAEWVAANEFEEDIDDGTLLPRKYATGVAGDGWSSIAHAWAAMAPLAAGGSLRLVI